LTPYITLGIIANNIGSFCTMCINDLGKHYTWPWYIGFMLKPISGIVEAMHNNKNVDLKVDKNDNMKTTKLKAHYN